MSLKQIISLWKKHMRKGDVVETTSHKFAPITPTPQAWIDALLGQCAESGEQQK